MTLLSRICRFLLLSIAVMILIPTKAYSVDYHVGPGQALLELDQVPWLELVAGDTVNIYYRAEPYRTKIGLRAQGTEAQPIVIRGLPGINGEKPVISGQNARTPASLAQAGFFSAQYDENLALILIKRGPNDDYATDKPSHIIIEGLKLTGAYEAYSYTNSAGNIVNYSDGAAPVWAVLVDNLIVRNCELTDSGNGLFVLSKPGGAQQVSHNILVEHNYIHGNGTTGARFDRHHNIYTQASGIVFQYNHFGRLRPGAGGSVLKDRSGGTIIRFNWVETGARVLDLVDPEEAYDYLVPRESVLGRPLNQDELDRLSRFRNTYVYGNIFVNDLLDNTTASTSNMFHYGGDTGVEGIYRKGVLHFYNNTVYIRTNQSLAYFMRLFDLSTNDETVSLKNNIFYQDGDSLLRIGNRFGRISFDSANFINPNWGDFRAAAPGASVTIAQGVSLIESNTSCFNNKDIFDFSLQPDSVCIDEGTTSLGNAVIDKVYVSPYNFSPRQITGAGIDLGAYEDGSAPLARIPNPPTNLRAE
ncbi:MAG: hypothetical protein OEZ38_05290 [Gammaproteobacteria bacterium]|nr:hypothetical protein [Gammaproteobacteria bacterium]